MSRTFSATFTSDIDLNATMSSDDSLSAKIEDLQETVITEYNFGNGLEYDYETNTLSADMTEEVTEGSDSLITSGAVAEALSTSGISYSANERIVGTWTNGKTLYERMITITNTALYNSRESGYAHGIENVDEIIVAEAYLIDTSIVRTNGCLMNAIGGVVVNSNNVLVNWCADDTYIWINATTYFNASESRTWKILVRYTVNEV